jgi:hypothetical protein
MGYLDYLIGYKGEADRLGGNGKKNLQFSRLFNFYFLEKRVLTREAKVILRGFLSWE